MLSERKESLWPQPDTRVHHVRLHLILSPHLFERTCDIVLTPYLNPPESRVLEATSTMILQNPDQEQNISKSLKHFSRREIEPGACVFFGSLKIHQDKGVRF